MSNIQAISLSRHAGQKLLPHSGYAFAAGDNLAALVLHELPKAMLHFAIGFLPAQGGFMPVAVVGLNTGENLWVDPAGRWLAGYVPAIYRSYPFVTAQGKDDKQTLCMDEDSGLLSSSAGADIFNADGQPSKTVADVLHFLAQLAGARKDTQAICNLLQKHNLIQPWPIKLKGADTEQSREGLFCIDEAVLNQLSAEALLELRNGGALMMAYCQLFSVQNLQLLGPLADARAKAHEEANLKHDAANTSKVVSAQIHGAAPADTLPADSIFGSGDTFKFPKGFK